MYGLFTLIIHYSVYRYFPVSTELCIQHVQFRKFHREKLPDGPKNNWPLCHKTLTRLILIWVSLFTIHAVSKILRFEMSLIAKEAEDKSSKLNPYSTFTCEIYTFHLKHYNILENLMNVKFIPPSVNISVHQ